MAGTTLRKESAACVDAEISILMQREAENDRAQDSLSWARLGGVANLLRGFGEMRRPPRSLRLTGGRVKGVPPPRPKGIRLASREGLEEGEGQLGKWL